MMLTGKDSFWLQLEVCREFQRSRCTRADVECKFAHPPTNVEVQANGRVTACYDSIKGRCQRESCKYMHPPAHLKDQLLINGRNHLALKNALLFQQQQQQQQQQQHHRQLISNFPSLQHQADLSLLAKHPQQHPGHLSHHQQQQQHQQQQHAALLQSAMALAAASTAARQASSSPFGLPSHPSQPNHSSPAMRPTAAFDLSMQTNPTAAALAAALAATSSMSPFLAPAGPHFGPPTYAGQYAAAAAMAAAAAAAATQQHPHAHLRHPQPAQTANKTPNGPPSSQGRDSERTPEGSSALMAPPGKQQEPAASSPVQTSPSTGGRPDADQLAAFYGLSPAVLAAAASATAALLGGAQPAPNSLGLVPATTSVSSPNHSATHQSNGQSRASPKEQTKANGIAVHESKHKSSDAPGAAGEAIDRCDKKRLLNGSSKGDQTFEGPDGTRESKRLRSEGDKQADDGRPSEPERQQTNCDSQSSDCNGLDAGTDTDAGHLEDSKEASKVQVECKSSNNHVDSNGQSKERQKQPGSPVEPKLEICREFLRNSCKRSQSECRFAHPPRHLINHNSRPLSAAGCLINDSFGAYVTVCRDYLRGRCTREDSKCRFLHPEAHLQTRLDFKRHRGGAKLSH